MHAWNDIDFGCTRTRCLACRGCRGQVGAPPNTHYVSRRSGRDEYLDKPGQPRVRPRPKLGILLRLESRRQGRSAPELHVRRKRRAARLWFRAPATRRAAQLVDTDHQPRHTRCREHPTRLQRGLADPRWPRQQFRHLRPRLGMETIVVVGTLTRGPDPGRERDTPNSRALQHRFDAAAMGRRVELSGVYHRYSSVDADIPGTRKPS